VTQAQVLLACLGVMALATGGALWYRALRLAALPKDWIQTGPRPAGVDVALRIIFERAPGRVRAGGYIEWVEEPFWANGILVAGLQFESIPVRAKVLYYPLVEQTALAHEIAHAWWEQLYDRTGEGEPDFLAWIRGTNLAIAAALEGTR